MSICTETPRFGRGRALTKTECAGFLFQPPGAQLSQDLASCWLSTWCGLICPSTAI